MSASFDPSQWEDSDAVPRRLQHAPRRPGWQRALGATLGVGLTAVILGGIGIAVWQMQSGADRANLPAETATEPTAVAEAAVPREPLPQADLAPTATEVTHKNSDEKSVAADVTDESQSPLDESPSPPAAVSEPSPVQPVATPARAAAFRRAVNQTRAALIGRDLKRAAKQLALAQRDAVTPDERDQAKWLAALTAQLERFFDVVRAGLQRLQPTDEIRIGEWVAIVVERGPESLALFDEGSRRDYTLATLPAKVALFAARAGADEKTPQMKLATGAFQAVDPGGDRDVARRLWNEAATAGQEVDDLLPFLESSALAVSRDPVPDADLVRAAERRVDTDFSSAIESARSAAQKSDLAVKLMTAARDAENPLDQYALLKRATGMATTASDARLALQAEEELARWFDVDALAIKSQTLSALSAQRASAITAKYIARRALELAEEAKSQDRGELAKTLADTAVAAARKARDPELVKVVTERRRGFSTPTRSAAPAGAKRSRKSASGE